MGRYVGLSRLSMTTPFVVVMWLFIPVALPGQITFHLAIEDCANELKEQRAALESNLLAAAELWAEHFDGTASIEIVFRIDHNANAGRGSGNSVTVAKVAKYGRNVIYEQGMAYEIRTGVDPNGDEPDVVVILHPEYLKTLWFDPSPKQRTAPVPDNHLDAVSVFLHELGHALAFNGWLDQTTGELKGEAMSTYDRYVVHDGREFYFVGLNAMRVHGGPIPLSREQNNYHHVGRAKSPKTELADDLMNGIVFEYGKRYFISELDLAILADTGIPVKQDRILREPESE